MNESGFEKVKLTRQQMIDLLAEDTRENTNWDEVIHLDGNGNTPVI